MCSLCSLTRMCSLCSLTRMCSLQNLIVATDVYEACKDAHAVILITEWR